MDALWALAVVVFLALMFAGDYLRDVLSDVLEHREKVARIKAAAREDRCSCHEVKDAA